MVSMIVRKLVAGLFFVSFFLILSSKDAFAQLCPASWTNDPNTLTEPVIYPPDDGWFDFDQNMDWSYSFDVTHPDEVNNPRQNVRVGVRTNIPTTVFTKIFGNYSNTLFPFIQASSAEILNVLKEQEAKEAWLEYYCLSKNNAFQQNAKTGNIDLEITGHKTFNIEVRKTKYCDAAGVCGNCGGGATPTLTIPTVCYVEEQITEPEIALSTESVTIPYLYSLRDVARKTAYTIKEQPCSTAAEQNACLNDTNYVCVKVGERKPDGQIAMLYANDPANNDKDGVCALKLEYLDDTIAQRVAQNMCSDVSTRQDVGSVKSNICHYKAPLTYEPSNKAKEQTMYVTTEIGNSDNSKNNLPFDVDLFADKNEFDRNPRADGSVNHCDTMDPRADISKCEINGYYRRAFMDKLGLYTEQDKKIFDGMKYRINVSSDAAVAYQVDGTDMEYGKDKTVNPLPDAWTFDYVEKLGGIALYSEDARFMNPYLKPMGEMVVSDGGAKVYLRGDQVFFNNYIVTNRAKFDSDGVTPLNTAAVSDLAYEKLAALMDAVNVYTEIMRRARDNYAVCVASGEFSQPQCESTYFYVQGNPDPPSPITNLLNLIGTAAASEDAVVRQILADQFKYLRDPVDQAQLDNLDRLVGRILVISANSEVDNGALKDLLQRYRLVLEASVRGVCGDPPQPGCLTQDEYDRYNRRVQAVFEEALRGLRNEVGVAYSSSNPTIHLQHMGGIAGRYLVTFIADEQLYYGISEGGNDIERVTKLPIDGATFNQIPHRGYLTPTGNVVVVYSDLNSNTYKVSMYDPTKRASVHVTADVPGLGSVDAVFQNAQNGTDAYLHLVGVDELNASKLVYRRYLLTQNGIQQDGGTDFNLPFAVFLYFRPAVNIAIDGQNGIHMLVVSSAPGENDEFFEDMYYASMDANGGNQRVVPLVTHVGDRAKGLIPASTSEVTVGASRLFSRTGRSLVIGPNNKAVFTYINRAFHSTDGKDVRVPWETYTQAFLGSFDTTTPTQSVVVVPISEKMLVPFGEAKNPFVDLGGGQVGLTLMDNVNKLHLQSNLIDALGAKQCLYNLSEELLFAGNNFDCGRAADYKMLKTNGGDWELVDQFVP